MKIALLTPFYPYRGGIAQFSESLYAELSKTNDVEVFSFSLLYPSIIFPGKTQFVTDIDSSKYSGYRMLNSLNPLSYTKTAKRINEFNPEALIVAYWIPQIGYITSKVLEKVSSSIKKIGLIHNAIPHEQSKLDSWFSNPFFKACDAFITMSKTVSNDIKQLLRKDNISILEKEHPIYNHYSNQISQEEARKYFSIPKNKKVLLFFGFIRPYKGLDLLIEAFNYLNDDFFLLIVGECYKDLATYKDLIEKSPNKERILTKFDYVTDSEVSIYFEASDVLVLPYRSATQSGVLATAYQFDKPIIATPVGGIREAIMKAGTGLLAKDVSSLAIADTIQSFFKDAIDYKQAIEKEKARLSWSNFSQAIEQFIKSQN